MSKEIHPNLHASGFTVDIIKSLQIYIRGNARGKFGEVIELVENDIMDFVVHISTKLDKEFGVDTNEQKQEV